MRVYSCYTVSHDETSPDSHATGLAVRRCQEIYFKQPESAILQIAKINSLVDRKLIGKVLRVVE